MASETHDIQIASIAPDFTLDTYEGRVSLADYRGKNHVVLYFMRAFDCPVCQHHVARLGRIYPTLQAQQTTVLVIGAGNSVDAAKLRERFGLPFPVLADVDGSVYRQYNLNKALSIIQQSGSFLIDIDGVVRYANRSTLPTGALNETLLLRAIDNVQAVVGH
jgi:peroxiredoxin Q/BCP